MNMRAGSTMAMYWSPATMFKPKAVTITAAIDAADRLDPADDRRDQPGVEAAIIHHGAKRHRPQDQPDGGQHAVHASAREQGIDLGIAG